VPLRDDFAFRLNASGPSIEVDASAQNAQERSCRTTNDVVRAEDQSSSGHLHGRRRFLRIDRFDREHRNPFGAKFE
jgi:hypothetical protein